MLGAHYFILLFDTTNHFLLRILFVAPQCVPDEDEADEPGSPKTADHNSTVAEPVPSTRPQSVFEPDWSD